jgi:hypothetical protein
MKDRNGAVLDVGDRVVVVDAGDSGERYLGRFCTVRDFGEVWNKECLRIDDGNPSDNSLQTNGFHWSAWVEGHQVVKAGGK